MTTGKASRRITQAELTRRALWNELNRGDACRSCGHDFSDHHVSIDRPHLLRPLTEREHAQAGQKGSFAVYYGQDREGNLVLLRRENLGLNQVITSVVCGRCTSSDGGCRVCYSRPPEPEQLAVHAQHQPAPAVEEYAR